MYKQKGFSSIIVIVGIVILLGVGAYIYKNYNFSFSLQKRPTPSPSSFLAPKNTNNQNAKSVFNVFTDNTDYSQLVDSVKYNPFDVGTLGAKKFKDGNNLGVTGSFTKEIDDTRYNRVGGLCVPYDYNPDNKQFDSLDLDGGDPRHFGYGDMMIDSSKSPKVLLSLLKLRGNITSNNEIGIIFLCDLDNQEKILISLPSRNQNNKDTYIALLDNNYNIIGKVQLKTASKNGINDAIPIIYTQDKIFYLKPIGNQANLSYNEELVRINFANNSYTTLYQSK